MRNVIIAALLLLCSAAMAQTQIHYVPAEGGEEAYYEPDMLYIEDIVTEAGLSLFPMIDETLSVEWIGIEHHGLPACSEGNRLTITLEDEQSISLKATNRSNCRSISLFKIDKEHIDRLKQSKLFAITFMHERGHIVSNIAEEAQADYFVSLFEALASVRATGKR